METWQNYLKPSEWEVVVRAPGNFFLAGEHAVMFGHPAVCQAFPRYFYVGLRRRLHDNRVNIDFSSVNFVDVLDPEKKRQQFEYPSRVVPCQLEHLLFSNGWDSVDIGLYSDLPSMCGLASSGALAAALAIGLNYLRESNCTKEDLIRFFKKVSNPARSLCDVIEDTVFSRFLYPLAWRIDSLFHNHQSSGANAFFSLLGSPNGMPALYRQTHPRKSDLDAPVNGFNPSRTFSKKHLCPDLNVSPKEGIKCPKEPICPDFGKSYALYDTFPYEARELAEDFTAAGSDLFDFCCALLYSGKTKTTEVAIKKVKERVERIGAYFSKVPYLNLSLEAGKDIIMAYLGAVAEEQWALLGNYFQARETFIAKQILESIGYVQSGLRNLLWVSSDEIDFICRQAELAGFGAKLTGGGTGGDVVLVSTCSQWNELQSLMQNIVSVEGRNFRVHFTGRWPNRDFACIPSIQKTGSKRFLAIVDLKQSESMRTSDGNEQFDRFNLIVNNLSEGFDGTVLSYHRTDDQRFIAFTEETKCRAFILQLEIRLRGDLQKGVWLSFIETPYDWKELVDLEPSAAQSKWISDLVHGLKQSNTAQPNSG